MVSVNSPVKSLLYSRIHSRYNVIPTHNVPLRLSKVGEIVGRLLQGDKMTRLSSTGNVLEVTAPETGSEDQTARFHLEPKKKARERKEPEKNKGVREEDEGREQEGRGKDAIAFAEVSRSISQICL